MVSDKVDLGWVETPQINSSVSGPKFILFFWSDVGGMVFENAVVCLSISRFVLRIGLCGNQIMQTDRKSPVNFWSTNNKVGYVSLDPPKSTFFGESYFGS